jgi:hypothetical protein
MPDAGRLGAVMTPASKLISLSILLQENRDTTYPKGVVEKRRMEMILYGSSTESSINPVVAAGQQRTASFAAPLQKGRL